MNKIQEIAAQWLNNHLVDVVIGYANGSSGRTRACFVANPDEVGQLVFDQRCTQNLAHYLTRPEIKKLGRIGLVASVPVMRSVVQLISECQIDGENIKLIGIKSEDDVVELLDIKMVEEIVQSISMHHPETETALIETLKAMTVDERFAYWEKELSRCVKCYACRSGCPMCYCTRCSADCNQPQWVSVPSHLKGNFEWHLLRAMHLAGRCISCGECSRACPMDIPVAVLPMFLSDVLGDAFGSRAGMSLSQVPAMSSYCLGDKDHFIR